MDVRNEKNRRSRSHADNLSHYPNYRSVLKGHLDILFTVDGHEIHQTPPQSLVKFREDILLFAEFLGKAVQQAVPCRHTFNLLHLSEMQNSAHDKKPRHYP